VNEGIGMKKWEKYFREILGGIDGKVNWGKRERGKEVKGGEECEKRGNQEC